MHIENLVPESNDDARSPPTSSQCIITCREPPESLGQSRHIMLGQQRHRIGQPAKGYLERISSEDRAAKPCSRVNCQLCRVVTFQVLKVVRESISLFRREPVAFHQ